MAFGGNAALPLVLRFLGGSLMSNVLSKDLERFKGELQLTAAEHQIRFAKLHERCAGVLALTHTNSLWRGSSPNDRDSVS